jgi:hypothetical protein
MDNKIIPDFLGKRIWMYWPGEKAYMFKENVEKGFMACGLPEEKRGGRIIKVREVGDLDEIMNTKGGLEAALKEAYGVGRRIADGEKLMTEFANVMQPGDFVLARCEFDNIIGVGNVTSDYYFDNNQPRFKHCRKVEWINTGQWSFDDELKVSGIWHRVTLMEPPYRKIAEQIISQICEGKDINIVNLQETVNKLKRSRITMPLSADITSHKDFMNKARAYQESIVRQWAKQFGDICIWDERPGHGVWLKDEYALKGLVFYEGFRKEIMDLFHGGTTKIGINLLNNALRSEHIPYNLFFPMMKAENRKATTDFFNELLGTEAIAEVQNVMIEFSPQPKYNYLNDGTSFDAFVLYLHKDGRKGGIGIEVKYTEREYQIGETEYKNTHDEEGHVKLSEHYERVTRKSGYYLPNSEEKLVSDILRQIWRNHILGASMVQNGGISYFSSMTVFPDANPHFHTAPEEYRKVLTEEGKSSFFTFTYEKMFETMKHYFCTDEHVKWIDYLYKRYLGFDS